MFRWYVVSKNVLFCCCITCKRPHFHIKYARHYVAQMLCYVLFSCHYILNSKRNVVILNRRHNSTTRVLHVSFSGNMQSNIILNHDCAWKSYRGMECDLNGFQSIWYVNGHVDILYSFDVSFAVQYICFIEFLERRQLCNDGGGGGGYLRHHKFVTIMATFLQ